MKVKLNVSTSDGKNQPGDTVEVSDSEARTLIHYGYATEVGTKSSGKTSGKTSDKKES